MSYTTQNKKYQSTTPVVSAEDRANTFVGELLKTLENGDVLQWRKTWQTFGKASEFCNAEHKRGYRGGNILQVYLDMLKNGYNDSRYLTYTQITKAAKKYNRDGFLNKDATKKYITLVFYYPIFIDVEDANTKEKTKKCMGMKWSYTKPLYNIELTDLSDVFTKEAGQQAAEFVGAELDAFENLSADWLAPFKENGGDSAHYVPAFDKITMPNRAQFDTNANFISVLAHEQAHATGHDSRLKRNLKNVSKKESAYAFEELIAELTAFMFTAHYGIESDIMNSKAYIVGWAKRIKTEQTNEEVFRALSHAHKAFHYILKGEKMEDNKIQVD